MRLLPINGDILWINDHSILFPRSFHRDFLVMHISEDLCWLTLPGISMSARTADRMKDPIAGLDLKMQMRLRCQGHVLGPGIQNV